MAGLGGSDINDNFIFLFSIFFNSVSAKSDLETLDTML
jgi:hypothetical protein